MASRRPDNEEPAPTSDTAASWPEVPEHLLEQAEDDGWELFDTDEVVDAEHEIDGIPQGWMVCGIREAGSSVDRELRWELIRKDFHERAVPLWSASSWMSGSMTGSYDTIDVRALEDTIVTRTSVDDGFTEIEVDVLGEPLVEQIVKMLGGFVAGALESSICPVCDDVSPNGWRFAVTLPDSLSIEDRDLVLATFFDPCDGHDRPGDDDGVQVRVNGVLHIRHDGSWHPADREG